MTLGQETHAMPIETTIVPHRKACPKENDLNTKNPTVKEKEALVIKPTRLATIWMLNIHKEKQKKKIN